MLIFRRYYLLSLKQCDDNNLSIFRVISLWLDNQNYEFRPEGDETFEALLNSIPSWKFVTVLPQLAPRLTNENTVFMNNLKNLISMSNFIVSIDYNLLKFIKKTKIMLHD